jgi:hypothetical protein
MVNALSRVFLVAAALVAFSTSTASAEPITDRESPPASDAAFLEPQEGPPLRVAWTHAGALKPGDTVEIMAQGFPPHSAVEIGAGLPQSEYTVWAESQSTAQGTVSARVRVPVSVPPDVALVFVVSSHDYRVVARSTPIGLSQNPTPTRNDDLISGLWLGAMPQA